MGASWVVLVSGITKLAVVALILLAGIVAWFAACSRSTGGSTSSLPARLIPRAPASVLTLRACGTGSGSLVQALALLILLLGFGPTRRPAATPVPVGWAGRDVPLVKAIIYHLLRGRVTTKVIPAFLEISDLEGLVFGYQILN